jgi:formylglycine-generating enzyme required for sulfatase activity
MIARAAATLPMIHPDRRIARFAAGVALGLGIALLPGRVLAAQEEPPPALPAGALQDCGDCPPLVTATPGQLALGTPPGVAETGDGETPPVLIDVAQPIYIGRTEVTVGQFRRFVEATGHDATGGCRVRVGGQWGLDPTRDWRDPGFGAPPRDDDPVVCVNWDDAQAYVAWLRRSSGLRYRLPSEAEWEYAARGGTPFPRYWSAQDSDERSLVSQACDHANGYDIAAVAALRLPQPNARCSDGHVFVAPVAQFKPNAFGLHDALGNVREWTEDCYTASNHNRPTDVRAWVWQGGCEARVVRGGSFASRPRQVRAAARDSAIRGLRQSDLGFRVARDPQGASASAPAAP